MPDLNERMRGVDHVPFREDWDAVERRGPVTEPMHDPTGSRAARTIVILATTLLVLGVALYSLSGLASSTDGAGTGPTPGNSSTATYIDPAGIPITVDHPTDWFARSFTSSADGLSNGVEISNVESIVWPKDPAGQPQPSNYVRVAISPSKERVTSSLPDSPLPLSMDDASVTLGPGNTRQLMARVGGVPFVIQVSSGPNASDADLATADAIVASIRPNGTASPSASTVYTDPSSGWSVTAPSSLSLSSFGVPNPMERGDVSGVCVANFSTDAMPSGEGLKPLQQFPSTGVLFMMWENAPALVGVNTSDDTHLPLSLSDYRRIQPYVGGDEPTPLYRPLVEGGGNFVSVVWIGPQASETDRRAIEQTVASVTFAQLETFTISPTSTAIVLDAASSYPVGSVTAITPDMLRATASSESDFGSPLTDSGFYVVHGTGGYYGVPMNAQSPQTQDTCHVSADPTNITFSCANGAKWDRYVQAVTPPANQDEMHGFWLFVIPITVSWNGHLLANEGNDPRVATDAWGASQSPSG